MRKMDWISDEIALTVTIKMIETKTGKCLLGVNDIKKYLRIGHNKAADYLDGDKKITSVQFARKLI